MLHEPFGIFIKKLDCFLKGFLRSRSWIIYGLHFGIIRNNEINAPLFRHGIFNELSATALLCCAKLAIKMYIKVFIEKSGKKALR